MANTTTNTNGIITQVEWEGDLRKRLLYNTKKLEDWLKELEAECLLDPQGVEVADFQGLQANVVYRLRPKSRKRSKLNDSEAAILIQSKQFELAWSNFEKECAFCVGLGDSEELQRICYPRKLPSTWKGHSLVRELRDACDDIKDQIKKSRTDTRSCRVIGVRLGSGCGKSHLLLEAPKLLNYFSIYTTYNLQQALGPELDPERAKSGILLRILLRLAKIPNANTPRFFGSQTGSRLLSLDSEILLPFVLYRLNQIGSTVFIGVDEIMDLKNIHYIGAVISMLGELATQCYFQNDHQECYVFVSSLNIAPFHTSSGRPVQALTPESPDESAVDHVLKFYAQGRDLRRLKAVALSSAGFHFRSLVFAAEIMEVGLTPSVEYVLSKVCTRWKERIQDDSLFVSMKRYVDDLCEGIASSENGTAVEQYLDRNKALPPALICQAFDVVGGARNIKTVDLEHPLFKLFNCELAFTSPAKHLEQFGLYYDFFRHSQRYLVFSALVTVLNPSTAPSERSSKKSQAWFKGLEYNVVLTKSGESLFALRKKKLVLTGEGESLDNSKYYAPDASNHPLIDRAFTAYNGSEACLVLIQDKLNANVPKAVEDLNSAANLIKLKHPEMEVLCIVNVIGASKKTTAQLLLEHPYILVRDNSELDNFYSVNFASVARFARDRHRLEKEKEVEEERSGKQKRTTRRAAVAS